MTALAEQNKKEPTSVFEAKPLLWSGTPFLSLSLKGLGGMGGRGNFLSLSLWPFLHTIILPHFSVRLVSTFSMYLYTWRIRLKISQKEEVVCGLQGNIRI